jgi:hypothetical protein
MVGKNPVYGYLSGMAAGADVYGNPIFSNRAIQDMANGALMSDKGYLGSITADSALDPMNNPYYKDQVTNLNRDAVTAASASSAAAGRRGSGLAAGVAAEEAQKATTAALNQQFQANQARQLAGKQLAIQATQQAAGMNSEAYGYGKQQQLAANSAISNAYQGEMGDWQRAAGLESAAYDNAAQRQLAASQALNQSDIARATLQLQAAGMAPSLQAGQTAANAAAVDAANQYYSYLDRLNNQQAAQYAWLVQMANGGPQIQYGPATEGSPGILGSLGGILQGGAAVYNAANPPKQSGASSNDYVDALTLAMTLGLFP